MLESVASGTAGTQQFAVYFLTWHGTVLRLDKASHALIHARPWPVRAVAYDWSLDLPGGRLTAPTTSPADAGTVLRPRGSPFLATIQRGDDYLCAEPASGEVLFNRQSAGIWETFLLVSAAELAALRDVLAHTWTTQNAGCTDDERITARLEPGFKLFFGDRCFDLRQEFPPATGDRTTIKLGPDWPLLKRAEQFPVRGEIDLTRRPADLQAPLVGPGAFSAMRNGRLSLPGGVEYGLLPLAASRADEEWMLTKWLQPGGRRLGEQRNVCQLVRESDKFVLLSRRCEGLVFDSSGSSNETGYLLGVSVCDSGELAREGDHVFVSEAALAAAPRLHGPHAVFYGGNLSNYYHWVIDALLPLFVMAPLLPPGTKLLLPGTLRAFQTGPAEHVTRQVDHLSALREWGFGDWPMVEIDDQVCHVDDVYWLDQCSIEQMPAAFVQAARRDVLARLGAAQGGRRIYIRRETTRSVSNTEQIEQLLQNDRFTLHAMEGMTPKAQMELFRDAEFVVAPHGAALANLLFCAPGTRVIELSPDCEFRPLFAQISDKLDLVHAVLPCPTYDGGFFGRMQVDAAKLDLLMRQLQARAEAA